MPSPPFYGQGQTYLSAQTGFMLTCPPGFSCDAGFYPTPIVVPKGGVPFTPPTGGNPLRFTCCDGSIEVRQLPDGFTQAEFDAAAQSIADAAAVKLAGCIAAQYNQQHARQPKRCTITTASPLPSGDIGVPYSATLAQTGATLPVTWSLLSGALPPGLSLSSSGVIAGTPTGVGASYGFVVRLANTAGTSSCTKLFTLTINDCTSADWFSDPGNCRLRIQDFDPADWPDSPGTCDTSFVNAWDGAFPFLFPPIGPGFSVRYSAGSDITATPRFVLARGNAILDDWTMAFVSPTGIVWIGSGPVSSSPLGVFTRNPASCSGPASLVIEGYSPSP